MLNLDMLFFFVLLCFFGGGLCNILKHGVVLHSYVLMDLEQQWVMKCI